MVCLKITPEASFFVRRVADGPRYPCFIEHVQLICMASANRRNLQTYRLPLHVQILRASVVLCAASSTCKDGLYAGVLLLLFVLRLG